ncbi:hypothetical protein ACVIJU_003384 [Aeribacillus sp. SP014]
MRKPGVHLYVRLLFFRNSFTGKYKSREIQLSIILHAKKRSSVFLADLFFWLEEIDNALFLSQFWMTSKLFLTQVGNHVFPSLEKSFLSLDFLLLLPLHL